MSHVVVIDDDGVRVPLARRQVASIARAVLRAEGGRRPPSHVSISFVTSRRIAALNRRHLGHRGSTDVISFTLAPEVPGARLVGDIYIAPSVARRNAETNGVTLREELTRLVVHGVLHVLGHDHPEGRDRAASPMWRRQEQLVASVIRTPRRRSRGTRRARSAA
ncbi:MAG TPA: rRNA maturation RNase YbeY [Gemmatimonadaceae bacterium]|jgi:probable rRNA maturation factor